MPTTRARTTLEELTRLEGILAAERDKPFIVRNTARLPIRLATWWRIFSRRYVIVRTIVVCSFLFGLAFVGVINQQVRRDRDARASDKRDVAIQTYNNRLRTYDLEVDDRQRCLTSVETRDTVRSVLFDFANGIVDILPGEPKAVEFRDARVSYVNSNYPPLDPDNCRPEPTFPELPEELEGVCLDESIIARPPTTDPSPVEPQECVPA